MLAHHKRISLALASWHMGSIDVLSPVVQWMWAGPHGTHKINYITAGCGQPVLLVRAHICTSPGPASTLHVATVTVPTAPLPPASRARLHTCTCSQQTHANRSLNMFQVHGFGLSSAHYRRAIAALSTNYKVLAGFVCGDGVQLCTIDGVGNACGCITSAFTAVSSQPSRPTTRSVETGDAFQVETGGAGSGAVPPAPSIALALA